jgi:hypothetical protein
MLALLGLGLVAAYQYDKSKNPLGVSTHPDAPANVAVFYQDPRAKGPPYAQNVLANQVLLGPRRIARPIYHEQHPMVQRGIIPRVPETPEMHALRMKRLAEALPEGPFSFATKSRAYDRPIVMQRLPIMHPGLTRVGSDEHHAAEPMWGGKFKSHSLSLQFVVATRTIVCCIPSFSLCWSVASEVWTDSFV